MNLIHSNDTNDDALLGVADVISFVNEAMCSIVLGEQNSPTENALNGMVRILDACDSTLRQITLSNEEE